MATAKKPSRAVLERQLEILRSSKALCEVGYAGALLSTVADLVANDKESTTLRKILEQTEERVANAEWQKMISRVMKGI